MNPYQEQLMDHYKSPRSFGIIPENFISHKASNLSCGDEIEIGLMIQDGKIQDVMFNGEGCSIAIATASIVLETLQDKLIDDVRNLDEDEILKLVGIELTPSRQKCALLTLDVLKQFN